MPAFPEGCAAGFAPGCLVSVPLELVHESTMQNDVVLTFSHMPLCLREMIP
jgi:hypothetical protein